MFFPLLSTMSHPRCPTIQYHSHSLLPSQSIVSRNPRFNLLIFLKHLFATSTSPQSTRWEQLTRYDTDCWWRCHHRHHHHHRQSVYDAVAMKREIMVKFTARKDEESVWWWCYRYIIYIYGYIIIDHWLKDGTDWTLNGTLCLKIWTTPTDKKWLVF